MNIPLLHVDMGTGQMTPNPDFLTVVQAHYPSDTHLIIGCKTGQRSARAAA
ncbi:rhodanese-like domain-containing protein, partial [candidate division KSB1 bacterium]|nr:rhodanese-like domain-containing protein [candidate division KSB1 bacterium]